MKRTIRFQLDGVTHEVQVERQGAELTVSREGERYTVRLLDTPAGPPSPEPASAAFGQQAPPSSGRVEPTPAPAPGPAAGPKPASASGAGLLRAPMTGLVKEVKVAPGSRVARGEVVLVMEAMKMDVEVSAPAAGEVAEVHVSAGQSVEAQAPLLRIRG